MSGKKSLLVINKILRLFANTLSADDNYFVINRDTLRQPIQMPLSHKEKAFSDFFSSFLKSILNFKNFQKNDDSHRQAISAIMDSEQRG